MNDFSVQPLLGKKVWTFLPFVSAAMILVSLWAIGYTERLRPIKVFSQYYLCRLASVSKLADVDCRTLPTVTIQPPSRPHPYGTQVADPRELQLFFQTYSLPDHVYVHGTNSPEHVRVFQTYYRAFEFDAFWDAEREIVDIFHWPNHTSINFLFRDFLALIPKKSYLWMDLKNLSNENLAGFRSYMKRIFQEIPELDKQRIIIESKVAEAVSQLNQDGFQTAYYLPKVEYNGTCRTIGLTETIVRNIKAFPTSFISFPYWQQQYIDDCLLPLTGPLEQISWGGTPFAIPPDALARYHAYIVDHELQLPPHDI